MRGSVKLTLTLTISINEESIASKIGAADVTAVMVAVVAPGMSAQASETGSCTCSLTASVGVVPETAVTLINKITPEPLALVMAAALLPLATLALLASTETPAIVSWVEVTLGVPETVTAGVPLIITVGVPEIATEPATVV